MADQAIIDRWIEYNNIEDKASEQNGLKVELNLIKNK